MKYKYKKEFLWYLLFSIFLQHIIIECNINIYPDNITPGDPIFNHSQVYEVTNERFIYSLGYYTQNTNNYYSKKYGIYYEPVSCTGSISNTYQDNNFFRSVIKSTQSTNNKGNNIFEEVGLFQNGIKGCSITCPSNLKVIQDVNLKITYAIPVYVDNNNQFTLDVVNWNGGEEKICDLQLIGNKPKIIRIEIKVESILSSEVILSFQCTDTPTKNVKFTKNQEIIFKFNKSCIGHLYLSNFRITVEDLSTKTGIKYNKLLDRSKKGISTNQGCTDSSDCFRGFICVTGFCKPCHFSCSQCFQDSSSTSPITSCKKCGSLTIDENAATNNNGICPINFVDLSQFKDISANILPYGNEYNDRATVGMWLFFSDLKNSRSSTNDIYHIILQNRMVISIVPGDNVITAYCHAYEDLYRKVTSDTTLYSNYYDKSSKYVISQVIPNNNQLNQMDMETINGKWFHISCAISFDHEKFYLKSVINGVYNCNEKSLKKEKLYPESNIENNVYYNHIINDGDYLVLKIKNFSNSKAKIYGKHLMFFKEYISQEMQYMYFNFKNVNDFKEIMYQIPLDELIMDPSYKIKGYQYDSGSIIEKDIPLELSHNDISDFKPPLNFYRLLLNEPNQCYTQIDFREDSSNTITKPLFINDLNSKYSYDDNKILNCKNNFFYNEDPMKCLTECQSSTTYPGISKTTGYCDYRCPSSFTCPHTPLPDEKDYDYNNNKYCQDYTRYYNLFYKCVSPSQNYYLQFSGFYNSQTIQFNLPTPLKSYIIEFWFYPDFFLQSKSRKSQFNYPTYTKNFFFHSNVIECYFSQTDRLIPYIYDSYKIIKINKLYNSNEWNKFVIHGKYYPETQDYVKTVYVNHAFDQPFSFDVSKENKASILESITFCENKCQDINTDNIHWTTGYYKDLRIWDGDMASYSQVVQYNDFYPIDSYPQRIYGILYYFPFSNQYIANNKIVDPDVSKEQYIYFNITRGSYFLKKYNYGTNFDIIAGSGNSKKYSQHASDPPFIDDCDIGCNRCWERTLCYECIGGYFLSGRKCLQITNYYYRNPNKQNDDIILHYNDDLDGMTISFWTKPIGFKDQNQIMITLATSNSLKLGYSSLSNPIYGLYLLGNDNSVSVENNIIGCDSEFRDNIGKWTFISIAYHKKIGHYFPRMIKYEINTNSIEADSNKIKYDIFINEIKIDKGYFGLFVGIKVYRGYIIQAITYEEPNQPNIKSPFVIPSLIQTTDYGYNTIGLTCTDNYFRYNYSTSYECVPDEKPDIGLFLDTCDLYKDTLTTENSCLNSCSGKGWSRCNCLTLNHNSQMILKNKNKNFCRPLEYINFVNMQQITINNLSSAKEKNKCTLQFWMYAFTYISGGFKGITLEWTDHNKIEVKYESSRYKFKCFPKSGSGIQTDIEINQWIFLSCAVDYRDNQKIYLDYNTQDNKIYLDEGGASGTINSETSTLIITNSNNNEWGVLFFRQIRLWKDAYFNAGFLSRIFIETPSKFDKLLHSWEPAYKGSIGGNYNDNFFVNDIVKSKNFYIVYNSQIYGMNVVDEEKYSILTMCSENGLYYDSILKQCLQFIDLSKMKDFTFKELPSSYSGSYAMAFWIFFEDCDKYREKGLHLNWSRHLQITIKKDENLEGICFPQGYYSDYEDNDSNFENKYTNSLNKARINLVDEDTSEDGVWIWVICSVSYYERKFYIKGNRNDIEDIPIIHEILDVDTNKQTSYPMRYYLSDLNNNVMYKSKLSIINIDPQSKLYLREILLFRNHIPNWYAEKMKYMNVRMLSDNQLPALLFVVNFADFNLETKSLKYVIFERQYKSTSYERIDTSILLSVKNAGSTFELSANFQFQPLCDLSTQDYKKYDTTTETCVDIEDCVLRDIHATYCMGENMPLSCETGYMLTLDNSINKIQCTNQCIKEEFITPGTPKDRGICNTFCPDESKVTTTDNKCQTTVKLMSCDAGYDRIAYQCLEKTKNDKSALFFSKCYNSPNFYRTISTTTLNQINSGYFYEFWIKIDNQLIQPKTCKEAGSAEKEYYLYSTPHSIYKEKSDDSFYYQIINTAHKKQMTGIDTNKWNNIVIETRMSVSRKSVYVHTNFEKDILEIKSIAASINLGLQYISFCSRKTNGDCIPGSSNIMWGSAYYREIKIWNIKSSSIQVIQDYNNKLVSDIPKSLILYYHSCRASIF